MSPLPLVATLNMVLPSLSLTIAVAPLIAVLSLSVTRARRCDRKQQTLEGSIKRILFENRGTAWNGQKNRKTKR